MDKFYYHIGLMDYSVGLPFPGVPTEMDEMPWLYDFEVLRSDCPLYLLKDEFVRNED